jgi:phosphoribosylformylglycinamidine cyclo-ligase
VLSALATGENIKGIAHITGGGLTENIPRVLPKGCSATIEKNSWPSLAVFDTIKDLGNIEIKEMYRAFNMGIGMVFIVDKKSENIIKTALKEITSVYKIGQITSGNSPIKYV